MRYTTKGHRVDDLTRPDKDGCRAGIVIWEDETGPRATLAMFAPSGDCYSHLDSGWRLQEELDNVVYLHGEGRKPAEPNPSSYFSDNSFFGHYHALFQEFLEEQIQPEDRTTFYVDLLNAYYTPLNWRDYSDRQRNFIRKVVINAAVKAAIHLLPED